MPELIAAAALDGTKYPALEDHKRPAIQAFFFHPVDRVAEGKTAPGLVRQGFKERGIVTITVRQSQ